jgi:hypothetical protein
MRLTASKTDLALRCSGWLSAGVKRAPYDSSKWASKGTDVHQLIEETIKANAIDPTPGLHAAWVADWWLERRQWCQWLPEVMFGVDPKTGDVIFPDRPVGPRDYSWAPGWYITGTADGVAIYEEDWQGPRKLRVLHIADWKTGLGAHVPLPADNAQLGIAAFAFSSKKGREKLSAVYGPGPIDIIRVEVVKINDSGAWAKPADIHPLTLDVLIGDLSDVINNVKPALRPGWHCHGMYCGSYGYCDATRGINQISQDFTTPTMPIANHPDDVTGVEHAAYLLGVYRTAKARLDGLQTTIHAWHRKTGTNIPTHDGFVYGLKSSSYENVKVETPEQVEVLKQKLGAHWEAAVGFKVSKASIKLAARKVAEERGSSIVSVERDALAALEAVGGMTDRASERFDEFRP